MKHPLATTLLCLGLAFLIGLKGHAQAPATIHENPLAGTIDFHVHSGPDSFTRSVTDLEIARLARAAGMRALVLKNHFTLTADRAYLAEREDAESFAAWVVRADETVLRGERRLEAVS